MKQRKQANIPYWLKMVQNLFRIFFLKSPIMSFENSSCIIFNKSRNKYVFSILFSPNFFVSDICDLGISYWSRVAYSRALEQPSRDLILFLTFMIWREKSREIVSSPRDQSQFKLNFSRINKKTETILKSIRF